MKYVSLLLLILFLGCSPNNQLRSAMSKNDTKKVISLVEKMEADGEKVDYNSFLIAATKGQNITLVQYFIDKGANVDACEKVSGRTPLFYAATDSNIAILRILLKNGANQCVKDKSGLIVLNIVIVQDKRTVAEELIMNLDKLNIDTKDDNGYTPLLKAVQQSNEELTEALLNKGADVEIGRRDGYTPLMIAVNNGNYNIIGLLLKHGADVNNRNGLQVTPLMKAVGRQDIKVVKRLLQFKNIDVLYTNKHGNSAMLIAEQRGYKNILEILKTPPNTNPEEPQPNPKANK